MKNIDELLLDFPMGPLTAYRKKASFDWKKLKLELEGEDVIKLKELIWKYLQTHDVFNKSHETLPMDEHRKLTVKRMNQFYKEEFINTQKVAMNPRLSFAFISAIVHYDLNMGVKYTVIHNMFVDSVRILGTERHYKFIEAIEASEISGCFALTEISHGSNAKGMRTTAKHDRNNRQFILNTEDFESAKAWIGNLGKCATHAVVFAKLITEDGENHGLHAFVVPIRCPRTMNPFPGLIVGDLGEKIGLNGIDNGFLIFNSYRIPEENLLNRLGDINENGNYVSQIKDPNKRFGISLSILSSGRIHIGITSSIYLHKALIISLRYSIVRKQFGPDDSDEEISIIEYQQQQIRLIPFLAASYGTIIFSDWLCELETKYSLDVVMDPKNVDRKKALEMHAVSSATKPTISWLARDGIQICREACGGLGYLKAAGIGDLRNENDANCTYEGDNNVLIQQTSNWLLGLWKKIQKGEKIYTPFGTADFLNMHDKFKTLGAVKSPQDIIKPEVLLDAFKWLICYKLKLTSDKIDKLVREGQNSFSSHNNSQAYHAATLSVIFAEYCILDRFYKFTSNVVDLKSKNVLIKLLSLSGAWFLEKYIGTLYMGNYFTGAAGLLLREGIVDLCLSLKPDIAALTDVIAPSDFLLNSVLGSSVGNVYEKLQSTILTTAGAMSKPEWWRDILNYKSKVPSKL